MLGRGNNKLAKGKIPNYLLEKLKDIGKPYLVIAKIPISKISSFEYSFKSLLLPLTTSSILKCIEDHFENYKIDVLDVIDFDRTSGNKIVVS